MHKRLCEIVFGAAFDVVQNLFYLIAKPCTGSMEKCFAFTNLMTNNYIIFLTIFSRVSIRFIFNLFFDFEGRFFLLIFMLTYLTDRHWLMKTTWKVSSFSSMFFFHLALVTDEIFSIMSSGALFNVVKYFVKVKVSRIQRPKAWRHSATPVGRIVYLNSIKDNLFSFLNAILWWVCFQIYWGFAHTIPKIFFLAGQVLHCNNNR